MTWECYLLQERHGIISEPSGGSRSEKGEDDSEQQSRSLVLCLQTPTIKLFPDRNGSANNLGLGKEWNFKEFERIYRGCRIPPARTLRDAF